MRSQLIKALFLCGVCCFVVPTHAQTNTIETTGDVLLFAIPAVTLAATFVEGDTQGSWQFAKGFLLTEVVTYGLKQSINKSRPDLSNNNAFPSGHTSTVLQSASFVHRRYGFENSIMLYALAGFTAFTRMEVKKHDGFDLLAGAAIGIGSTLLFTTPYNNKAMELTLIQDEDSYVLRFRYSF